MWKFLFLLFLSLHPSRADIVDDLMLTDAAIQLLQIDNVQRLERGLLLAETSLKEKEQELQTMTVELENTKRAHATQIEEMRSSHADEIEKQESTLQLQSLLAQGEIEKSWTLVSFMMKVLKKSQGAAKAREELVVSQASMLKQLKDEIDLLKQTVSGESTVATLVTGISKDVIRGAETLRTEAGNWEILEECQDVLQKQSSSLDLLRTLVSERVTRNNSLRFTEDAEGHLVSASFCQCIPDPPTPSNSTVEVSVSLIGDKDGWSPAWSPWHIENCDKVTLSNGTVAWFGEGRKTRRRLKDINAEVWEEDVQEVPCLKTAPKTVPNPHCLEYNELNSPTRKSTAFSGLHCDYEPSLDWKGPGWYRVTGGAGTKLFETPIGGNRCGTEATGWMSGGHPSVAEEEVSRTVHFSDSGHNIVSKWTKQVKVINCRTHYVYYLVKTFCAVAYCTE